MKVNANLEGEPAAPVPGSSTGKKITRGEQPADGPTTKSLSKGSGGRDGGCGETEVATEGGSEAAREPPGKCSCLLVSRRFGGNGLSYFPPLPLVGKIDS